jgi:hypothetical protein
MTWLALSITLASFVTIIAASTFLAWTRRIGTAAMLCVFSALFWREFGYLAWAGQMSVVAVTGLAQRVRSRRLQASRHVAPLGLSHRQ